MFLTCDGKRRLRGIFLVLGFNRNVGTVVLFFTEYNYTVDKGKQGVVFTHTYVYTRVVYRTSLTHEDISCFRYLSAKDFYS